MINSSDIKSTNKFTRIDIGYSFNLSESVWDGSYDDFNDNNITKYSFDNNTKATLTNQAFFTTALTSWEQYSVFSFSENNTAPNLVAFQADTNNNVPTPNNGVPADGVTQRLGIINNEYVRAEIAIDESLSLATPVGYWSALHEIGHALGLNGDSALGAEYNTDITVMSYNVPNGGYAITPMALDIFALEEIYGASTFRTGNDTYSFVANSNFVGDFSGDNRAQTIVDTGGTDELDFSSYTGGDVTIDLRTAIDSAGNWTGYRTEIGDERIYLAHNTVIENATGGQGNDTLIGNDADNILDGRGGTDGVDYSHIAASLNLTVTQSQTIVIGADIGTDTLISIEGIKGGSGNDTFRISSLDLAGKLHLNGGAGADILDLSLITSQGVTIDGNSIVGTNITFEGFESIITTNQDDFIRNVDNMIIYTRDGSDQIEIGSNLYILDARADDRLTFLGKILDDGTKVTSESSGSNNPWTDWNSQGVRYGYNGNGDLVVQRLGEGEQAVELTYVANHSVDLIDSTASTLGISVYTLEYGAYGIGELPKGVLSDTLKSLRVQLEAVLGDDYTPPAVDPLILDLDGDGFDLAPNVNISPRFDLNEDGFATRTAWTLGGDDGFLAIDVNGSGTIDDVGELFGGANESGFAALSAYDANIDGVVDQAEASAANIQIWVDQDGDALTDAGELFTLGDYNITSINVTPDITTEVVGADHILLQQGIFTYGDGSTGALADVALGTNPYDSSWLTNVVITPQALALPQVKGHGTLPDLQAAMSHDVSFANAVNSALANFTSPDLSALRGAVAPILNGWVNSVAVPAGEPGTQGRIDVPILLQTTIGDGISVLDFGVQRSDVSGTYWELASGSDVLDGVGAIILRPTYSDILAQATGADKGWEILSSAQITFLERWSGEHMPLGMDHNIDANSLSAMNDLLGTLWNEINSVAVRIASQNGALSSFFDGVEYNLVTDKFEATTDRQLAPMLEKIFISAPNTVQGDQDLLDSWKGALDVVIDQYDAPATGSSTYGFLFQNLVAAYDNYPLAITIESAANTLDIPSSMLITGAGTLTGTSGADIFYMDGSDQVVNGEAGPDSFVFGRNIGNDIIAELDGSGVDYIDIIRFAAHNSSDLSFTRNGVDFTIQVIATGETITVEKQFEGRASGFGGGQIGPAYGIKEIVFADGEFWDTIDIAYAVSQPSNLSQDIIGTNVTDVLDGAAGDERLEGSGGGDIYNFGLGYGSDTIYDLISDPYAITPDIVKFGSGITFSDLSFSRVGHSDDLTVTVDATGDQLIIEKQFWNSYGLLGSDDWYSKIEGFVFENGQTITWEDIIQFMPALQSTDGNDFIYGFDYADTLDGGAGDDYLSGGNEHDTYVFGLGYGNDTVYDYYTHAASDSTDTVLFLPDVDPTTVALSRNGNSDDVVFTLSDGSTLTIQDQLNNFSIGGEAQAIEYFQFQDATNTLWDQACIKNTLLSTYSTSGDDIIYGFDGSGEIINGGAGNDVMYGLNGGDTYQFGVGYGYDQVQDLSQAYAAGIDKVEFVGGLTQSDVTFARDGDDLLISLNGYTDQLRVINQFDSNVHYQIENYIFSDGSSLDYTQVYAIATTGVVIDGDAFDNVLVGTDGDDVINGYGGADTINGGLGNDVLTGGAGNDYLDGDAGTDIYVIGDNAGNDWIDRQLTGDNDQIIFTDNILPSDITLLRTSIDRRDIKLEIDVNNSVTIEDFNAYNSGWLYLINQIEFSDGTNWDANFIRTKYLQDNTTSGDDVIIGFENAEDFQASAGDDYIEGYGGSDTYRWSAGSGNDTFYEKTGDANDQIIFEGLSLSDLTFSASGSDLIITNMNTSETLTIIRQLHSNRAYHIDNFNFSDGVILTKSDIASLASGFVTGTTLNDTLHGSAASEIFDGGAGDDILIGGLGDDTYVFNIGDGNNTITDIGGFDILKLGVGIAQTDLVFTQIGDDLDVQIASGFLIKDFYAGNVVEEIVFFDGTTFDLTTLLPPPQQIIDFTAETILDYGVYQNISDLYAIEDGGATLKLSGNTWKSIDFPYTVSANTILEFDFKSDSLGEIHAIGFDLDSNISENQTFALYGTQNWGLAGEKTYAANAGEWVNYAIDVGNYYTGDFTKLFFVNDSDINPTGDSYFRNIKIYDAVSSRPDNLSDITALSFEISDLLSIVDQDTNPTSVTVSGTEIELNGNTWKYVAYDYEVTNNSVLSFDFKSNNQGEIHAIGLDNDNNYTTEKPIQIYGTQVWGANAPDYIEGGNIQSFDINLSSFYKVGTTYSDIIFVNDDDANSASNSVFDNIRIYEQGTQNIDTLTGTAQSQALFGLAGDDVIYAGAGNDLLYGGSGVDELYGQSGADTFIFEAIAAFSASDNIQDFNIAEGDMIDISDVLEGYDPLTDLISDFVQITDNGTDSILSVDANGGADNFVQIAMLNGVAGLTDENALETNGNLITV